ncbi:1-aminocyclopropane-1-carboxylate deaminase/D-cysteine desulfhydrase [Streptacidiphilus sp. MAP5-3]|uniref:1-aminocyclopropane-1-carboxylate deaminase/D-cysteine desulfhydrase n=1 Tax=unclassified Streptacidiphilus TaxID=2643834 RepID=UPI003513AFA8
MSSPLQQIDDPRARRAGVRLLLKRDDLLHPPVSGTKWRKLRPNLERARADGHDTLLTFGGAYSNHLRATAAAGREAGLRTVGVVRGDELRDRELNPVLRAAVDDGMELDFISRSAWRSRMEPDSLREWQRRHGPALVVPEGGSNAAGVLGCVSLGEELATTDVQVAVCAVGTGGMLAGLAAGLSDDQRTVGFAALTHADLESETLVLQHAAFGGRRGSWRVDTTATFGGYGRRTPELDAFRAEFAERHGIALDPTYEAKVLYAVLERLGGEEFPAGSTVAVVIAG